MRRIEIGVFLIFFCLVMMGCGMRSKHRSPYSCPIVDETYIHKYGCAMSPEEWKEKGESGCVVTTLRDGTQVTKNYEEGLLNGVVSYTQPHESTLDKEEMYRSNELISQKSFYSTGAPKEEVTFLSPTEKLIQCWYENGLPRSEERFEGEALISALYYSPNHEEEARVEEGAGTRVVRDSFGTLLSRDEIQEGFLSLSITYYPQGTIKQMTPYREGKIEGVMRLFGPGGEPEKMEEWVSGSLEGTTTLFKNGEKIAEVPYHNGLKEGIEKRFKGQGIVVEEITWAQDKKHGPSTLYLAEEEKETDWYYDDKEVTKARFERLSLPPRLR